jgi:hypothetical protein
MKTEKTSHPDEAALLRHAAADGSRSEAALTRRHLATCGACRRRFATTRRIHAGLAAIGAAERRQAKKAAGASRVAAYRRSVSELFGQARVAALAGEEIL